MLGVTGHRSRRPNPAWRDQEPVTFPIYLHGHSSGERSCSTRCSIHLIIYQCANDCQCLGGLCLINLQIKPLPLLGQPQQAMIPTGRGQAGATAVPGCTPVQANAAQRAAGTAAPSPHAAATAPGQPPLVSSQANRPQQGQVKLTMAQLMQLTQGAQVRACLFSCLFLPADTPNTHFDQLDRILFTFVL